MSRFCTKIDIGLLYENQPLLKVCLKSIRDLYPREKHFVGYTDIFVQRLFCSSMAMTHTCNVLCSNATRMVRSLLNSLSIIIGAITIMRMALL